MRFISTSLPNEGIFTSTPSEDRTTPFTVDMITSLICLIRCSSELSHFLFGYIWNADPESTIHSRGPCQTILAETAGNSLRRDDLWREEVGFENSFDISNSHTSTPESIVNSFSVSDGHDVELELTALLCSDLVKSPRLRALCTGIAAPIMGNG